MIKINKYYRWWNYRSQYQWINLFRKTQNIFYCFCSCWDNLFFTENNKKNIQQQHDKTIVVKCRSWEMGLIFPFICHHHHQSPAIQISVIAANNRMHTCSIFLLYLQRYLAVWLLCTQKSPVFFIKLKKDELMFYKQMFFGKEKQSACVWNLEIEYTFSFANCTVISDNYVKMNNYRNLKIIFESKVNFSS